MAFVLGGLDLSPEGQMAKCGARSTSKLCIGRRRREPTDSDTTALRRGRPGRLATAM